MLKSIALILALTTVSIASAGEVVAVDTEGHAYYLRNAETALIVITDDAATRLAQLVKPTSDSPLQCISGICTIGEISRAASFSSRSGSFLEPAFSTKFASQRAKPEYMGMKWDFDHQSQPAYVLQSQCQNKKLQQSSSAQVLVQGRVAEQLYNFLEGSGQKNQRYGALEKNGAAVYCELRTEYDHADLNRTTGALLPGAKPSFREYECVFEFSPTGQSLSHQECHIYGASISAGGGN